MSGVTGAVLYRDPDLGRIFVPQALAALVSRRNAPTKYAVSLREVGIFVVKQRKPVFVDGHMHDGTCNVLTCHWRGVQAMLEEQIGNAKDAWKALSARYVSHYSAVWASITHNERVDVGAAIQFNLVFGTAGTTAVGVLVASAVANATLTKAKTDLGLGQATGGATVTNEFTTLGLSRAAATVSTYTAPASLGAVASQLLTKTYTASGGATALGGGIFDSITPTGSHLYVEDNYASSAVLVTNDTLTQQVTISN